MSDSISPPSMDEPIFECATVVVVRGFIAGASIDIFLTGPPDVRIGGGVSDSAVGQVFFVDSAKVTFGATIYATQTFEGTKSHPSPLASVQRALSPSRPTLEAPLFECAKCVRVDDVLPGAKVEIVTMGSGRVIGSAPAAGGSIDVQVSPPLVASSSSITAREVYCGHDWPPSPGVIGIASARGKKDLLPAPRIEEPVFACERYVTVSGCRPGCTVELYVNGALGQHSCTGGTSMTVFLPFEVQDRETLTARQTLCDGSVRSEPSAPVRVEPAALTPRPVIVTPLRQGDTSVAVLVPSVTGELLEVRADGVQVGMATGSGTPTVLGVDPPLVAGQRVVVEARLCDVRRSSTPVMVEPPPTIVPAPRLSPRIYECGHFVKVNGCLSNATVRVFATFRQNRTLIGVGRAQGPSVTITVTPALQAGWHITATQQVGDVVSASSRTVNVAPHPALAVPRITLPVRACSSCVRVENVVPGARVDVLQDGSWVGGAYASSSMVEVDVTPPLARGSSLEVTQRLCGETSSEGKAIVSAAPVPVPTPRVFPAYAGAMGILVEGLVPGALIEVEETSAYSAVIGRGCAVSPEQVVPLGVPLFFGAQIRVRQRLCAYSDYTPAATIGYPPEWPLGDGSYGAGSVEVDDIPVSSDIAFSNATVGGVTFQKPSKNKGLVFYPSMPGQEGGGAAIADGGPFPLIVVGHAKRWPPLIAPTCDPEVPQDTTLDFTQLSGILAHLARWGFVSICPDISWLTSESSHKEREQTMEDAIAYMVSQSSQSGSIFFGKLRSDAMGAIGHSAGGNATVYLGTSGNYPITVMGLLAPATGDLSQTSSMEDINQLAAFSPNPAMLLFGDKDADGAFGADGAPPLYYSSAGAPKYMVTIGGANHFGFTDSLCLASPGDGVATIAQADQQKIAKAFLTALFARYLGGWTAMDAYLDNQRPVEGLEEFVLTVQSQH